MIKLKRYNESVDNNKRLTREDLEDYFIDFIDSGDMVFEKSSFWSSDKYIKTLFSIGKKFCQRKSGIVTPSIKNQEDLGKFIQIMNRISTTCKQWNLDFSLNFGRLTLDVNGICSLEIRQPLPVDVIEHLVVRKLPNGGADENTLYHNTIIGDKAIKFAKKFSVDENNELYVKFTNCTVGPPSYKMTAADKRMWAAMDSQVIQYFENDFPVKMKFVKFAETESPDYWDSKSFEFKILQ